jgi:hypothetical protein
MDLSSILNIEHRCAIGQPTADSDYLLNVGANPGYPFTPPHQGKPTR